MLRTTVFQLVLTLTVLLASCAPDVLDDAQPLDLESAPRTQTTAGTDQRSAWQLPPANHVKTIAVDQPETFLRVGIRPEDAENPVRLTVLQDGTAIITKQCEDTETWSDLRIPLDPDGAPYTLALGCTDEFWLSHCEVVSPNNKQPNVLIFLVDTLRPDRLSTYGYDRVTSPRIDAFAKNAIRYTHAVAQSTWTRPSVASIMTSTYPGSHGAEDRPDIMRSGMPSLAETLRINGYTTIGIVTNLNVYTRFGFGFGFDRYVNLDGTDDVDRDRKAVELARSALEDVEGRPWMMYLHLLAPHDPYKPPSPFDQQFPPQLDGLNEQARKLESIRSRYDGEVAFADSLFGQLVDDLVRRDMFDNTIVVFTSDHGEQFLEHGTLGHGFTLFDEELLVPLIVKPPNFDGGPNIVDPVVELVDIAPTILDYAGIEPNARFQGISLANMFEDSGIGPRLGFAQLRLEQLDMHGVRSNQYKYVVDATTDSRSFFDLTTDPLEHSPIAEPFPESAAAYADHARMRAISDTSGFHLLITDLTGSNRPIECSVNIAGTEEYEMRNLGGAVAARLDGDTVSIEGRMKFPIDRQWGAVARISNYIHLYIKTNHAADEVAITFASDGPQTDSPLYHGGEDATPFPVDGTAIPLSDLIARPDRYAITTVPEQFALYAWYVPPVDIIRDEDLPPEVLERLDALGYVR